MDINVYIAILVFPLVLALIALLGGGGLFRSVALALISALGGFIAVFSFLAIGSDGSLTSNFTGTANVLATSSGNVFTWDAVILIPGILATVCFIIALGKGFRII